MAKNRSSREKPLKLPPDVLGTLKALLQTPPPPKAKPKKAKKKRG
jgi:hypothetical protein